MWSWTYPFPHLGQQQGSDETGTGTLAGASLPPLAQGTPFLTMLTMAIVTARVYESYFIAYPVLSTLVGTNSLTFIELQEKILFIPPVGQTEAQSDSETCPRS